MNPWQRFRRLWGVHEDLDEELGSHLNMAIQDRSDRGETRAQAERNARKELGNELLIKEITRDMWGWMRAERLGRDLSYALRQIPRRPGFSIIALLTLALGLSATTMMFSIVNGVLLEPLRFRAPGRLYLARTVPPANSSVTGDFPVNARHYFEWRSHCRFCEAVSLLQFQDLTLVGAGDPVKLPALGVSFNFFKTLGVQPFLGRDFLPGEDQPGRFAEVILTHELWHSRFAGDPGIVGRTIQLNGEAHTIVGVMPADLHLPKGDEWGAFFGPTEAPRIFRPLGMDASRQRPVGNLNYTSVIRLKGEASAQQAASELNSLIADFTREFNLKTKTVLIPLQQQITRNSRLSLWLLLGTVVTVLLIVCVNIGNLLVVRTASRYREAGLRMALGATRANVFSLALTEAFVLVAAGGVAGLALAYGGLKMLATSRSINLPRLEEVHMDWRVTVFACFAVAFSTIVCGVFPAWRLSRVDVHDSLKAGSPTSTETGGKLHIREILVSLEVALSTVLLIIGGLLMTSFLHVMRVQKGFEVAHIITQDVSYLSPKYAHGARRRFIEETVAKFGQIPGVYIAAGINLLPLRGDEWVSDLEDTDAAAPSTEHSALANFRFVTPGYWQALGIPLKMGRFLNDSDKNLPRAVISERAAQFLWTNQNPIGKHVRGVGQQSPSLEVVGVVGEVRAKGLEHNPPMIVYEHYWRMQPIGMSFVVRTLGNPIMAAGAMRSTLSAMDPEMAIPQAVSMEQIVERSVATRKFQMYLAVAFAMAALLLTSLGIYGVISFTVARRTPEIGIRVALGAEQRQLIAMVLRQGMRPVLIGLAAGMVCALSVSRFINSQLFGVAPSDPLNILGVISLLLIVAILACLIPARRASRVDPLAALRCE